MKRLDAFAILALFVAVGCGETQQIPPTAAGRDVEVVGRNDVVDSIEQSLDSPGGSSQRKRAMLQATMALGALKSGRIRSHYDWNGTERVTAEWDLREETRRGEPSFVVVKVPKSVGEVNAGAAASLAMTSAGIPHLRLEPDLLMMELIPEAIRSGAAFTSGFQSWAWTCQTTADTAEHWEFSMSFRPVAENFDRDEMQAEVKSVSGPEL